jgi:RNA polymerase sigma factor (TIGR02999 family)
LVVIVILESLRAANAPSSASLSPPGVAASPQRNRAGKQYNTVPDLSLCGKSSCMSFWYATFRSSGCRPDGYRPMDREPVTQLLIRWRSGDEEAFQKLAPLVYDELRQLAQRHMRNERPGHTMQPTALVHEAILKLADLSAVNWQDRSHFIRLASKLMRRILVDHARGRLAHKRGGDVVVLQLDEERAGSAGDDCCANTLEFDVPPLALAEDARPMEISAIDQVLVRLATLDERQAHVVEMRFFGGMTNDETALALDISVATVKREWTLARAWLHRELRQLS